MRLPSFSRKRGGRWGRLWVLGLVLAGPLFVGSGAVRAQAQFDLPSIGASPTPLPPANASAGSAGPLGPTTLPPAAPAATPGPLQRLFGGITFAQEPIPAPTKDKSTPEKIPAPEGEAVPEPAPAAPPSDNFIIQAAYKYNGGGGYLSFFSPVTDFTANVQNQVTLDGTFHDRPVGTTEQGFNIPFYRTYLFGQITKNIDYQVSVQGFLGQFNVLDAWGNFRYDDRFNFRVGRQLSPLLYEYYGWSPAWEPVITNSLLFQVAGKRQEGGMAWGRLFENKVQYQMGVFNGIPGAFVSLDHNVDFIGTVDVTPFKGGPDWIESLGGGFGVETGWHRYSLYDPRIGSANGAGEPTTNSSFITSTGIPFFTYNPAMITSGNTNKIAPHLYWYGRFSVVGEYFVMNRQLTDSASGVSGDSVLNGFYVNASYFLTGERYKGDGLGGYSTVTPNSPFRPTKGEWGLGAWELAFQYSQLNIGAGDFVRGFATPGSASRAEQTMAGVNWWPNKYTRCSFDWVLQQFNTPIVVGPPTQPGAPTTHLNVYWLRVAMFF